MNILLVEHNENEVKKFKDFSKDIAIKTLTYLSDRVKRARREKDEAKTPDEKRRKNQEVARLLTACQRAGVEVDPASIRVTVLQVTDCSVEPREWKGKLCKDLYFPLEVDKPIQKYSLVYGNNSASVDWTSEKVDYKISIYPWPHVDTNNAFEFSPHLVLLDRLFPEEVGDQDRKQKPSRRTTAANETDTETDKVWTKFNEAFKYIGYPSDVFWTLTKGDMRCFIYGFNASKPWADNTVDPGMPDIIGRCLSNRILLQSAYPGSREMYKVFREKLIPGVCIEYPDGKKISWRETGGTRYLWKYIPANGAPQDGCVNIVDESLEARRQWYSKFLMGELFLVPRRCLFDELSGELYHPWVALQRLVREFCSALRQNKHPELRSLYVALRQFANISDAKYIKGYVEAFEATRETAASASKLSSDDYIDPFVQMKLAEIYKKHEQI